MAEIQDFLKKLFSFEAFNIKIDKLTLSFSKKQIENEFLKAQEEESLAILRFGIILTVLLVVIDASLDIFVYPSSFMWLYLLRFLSASILIYLYFLSRKKKINSQLLGSVAALSPATFLIILVYLPHENIGVYLYAASFTLVYAATFFVYGLRFFNALKITLFITFFMYSSLLLKYDMVTNFSYLILFCSSIFLFGLSSYFIELQKRRIYLQNIHSNQLLNNLQEANKEIENIHKHTRESIEYAAMIQNTLIPKEKDFTPTFKDSFILWQPKDIVGGDIYLFNTLRTESESLLMVIDCTGHGVPGAFVTMIVKSIEMSIIAKIKEDKSTEVSPAFILSYFNKTLKVLLNQEENHYGNSDVGFDGGIIYYNKENATLKFAGANSNLFYIDKEQKLQTLKGNKHSIGYKKSKIDYSFKDYTINIEDGMKFYITTDGYIDQNGGQKEFPFGKKRFLKIIEQNYQKPMFEQKKIFIEELYQYQNNPKTLERNDDITLIGFETSKSDAIKELLLEYNGILTQNIIAHNIDILEHSISNISIMAKLSTLTIEMTQNMLNYSKSHDITTKDSRPSGSIEIYKQENIYTIITKNIVDKNDKKNISSILNEIQKIEKSEIKKRYKELRKSGKNMHSKGGGIGFYEIAKLAPDIKFEFQQVNEERFYFIFKVMFGK